MGGKVLDYEAKRIKNEGVHEGMEIGIEKGIEKGMMLGKAEGIIETGLDFGLSEKEILDRLQNKLDISLQTAQEYLQKYEKWTER